jgi:lipopolysaccharide export system permease protein
MVRTLDRYVIREVVPPFVLSLLIFTFLLVLPPLMDYLERLLAKGVTWTTAARILWTLVPQALGLTLPMALLVALLIGLGRMSADREAVALLACGVSPYRLLRPVGLLAGAAAMATMYVMIVAIPDANQTFRELTFEVITKHVESDVRPRVFFESFPGWVLYARDEPDPGQPGWKDLLVADTTTPGKTTISFAKRGWLVLNRAARSVHLVLENGTTYSITSPGVADTNRFPGQYVVALNPDTVFPKSGLQRGTPEKSIPELRESMAEKIRNGMSPHPEIMALQQKFSFPVACLVFAVIGLALGLSVAREGKLAGFVVGVAVVFAYYIFMELSESATKGYYSDAAVIAQGRFLGAHLARWVPNIVLGVFGIAALVARARHTEGLLPFRYAVRLGNVWKRRRPAAAQELTATVSPARRHERRAVVVVRVPRLRIPTLRLIDRYISRIYLRVATLSFCALLGLFYISTFIDKSEKLLKGKATTADVFRLMVYMTPQFVYFTIPIAALLSALVTFGVLSRSSELTVLKACGVSVYRTALSVVLLSLVFSGVLFGLEQRILGRANRQAEVLDAQIRDRPPRMYDALNRRWIIGREGDIYHFAFFDPERNQIQKLYVYRPAKNSWALQSTTYAERAAYGKDGWQAADGWVQEFGTDPPRWAAYAARPLTGLESPDYFKTEQPLAEMMTVGQLKRYVQELSASGFNVIPQAVELHKKLAFPFVTFVMTLLAVPFGVATGRRGTLYGIGLGIVIALSYWILISAFVAIGKGGLLAPVLAGWAPNILVFGMASYMMLTVRT